MAVLLDRPESRYDLRVALREEHGIQTTVFPAIHRLTAYRELVGEVSLPAAERAADAHMVLPLYPHMTAADQERVVESLRAALSTAA
jgi:dTDP-4-amino-4,6-dideoxygalactose transaminase